MLESIVNALKSLDVGNPNHWTSDGLPRLETVKLLSGLSALDREAVSNAAPGFTRVSPVIGDIIEAAEAVPPLFDSVAEAVAAVAGDGDISSKIAALEKSAREIREVLAGHGNALKDVMRELDALIETRDADTAKVSTTATIQAYLERAKQDATDAHEQLQALVASGIPQKAALEILKSKQV
jgi:hypothetical protein